MSAEDSLLNTIARIAERMAADSQKAQSINDGNYAKTSPERDDLLRLLGSLISDIENLEKYERLLTQWREDLI